MTTRGRQLAIALVVISNFIPLYSVIFEDWPVSFVVMLFCFDVLVLVTFVALRILTAPAPAELAAKPAWLTVLHNTVIAAVTLAVHGALALVYAFVLAMLFGGTVTPTGIVASPDVPFELMSTMFYEPNVRWAVFAIVLHHLHEFGTNAARRKRHPVRAAELFSGPIRHIVVLHVGIVLGGIVLTMFAPAVVAGAVLLGVKTVSDLRDLRSNAPNRVNGRST